jgi:TldD protein
MGTATPMLFTAPFSPGGDHAVDAAIAQKLLGLALDAGGDYADLYFEFRVSADYQLEEEQVRSVGRGITLGLGVRVTKGDATGYAYTEDLAWEKMAHAARMAGQIARGGKTVAPVAVTPVATRSYYPVAAPSLGVSAEEKLALLRSADRAARAADSRIIKVEASFVESWKEIAIFTSDGHMARDVQPILRFGVRSVAQVDGKRAVRHQFGRRREHMTWSYFAQAGSKPRGSRPRGGAHRHRHARRGEAPAGELPVVLGAGDSGILLHEAVGHGLEADFNRKQTSNYSGCVGKSGGQRALHRGRRRHARAARAAPSTSTTRATPRPQRAHREGHPARLHAGSAERQALRHRPAGNGRRESFRHTPMPRMTNTILLGGDARHRGHHQGSVKRGVYAKRFSGGQVNISNGDFVFSLTESYLIEDGKLTAPLKGVRTSSATGRCRRCASRPSL